MPKRGELLWTLDRIRDGIYAFLAQEGRMPTARDFDTFHLLPSARLIQSNYGGLPNLRANLNIEGPVDYTRGKVRSEVAGRKFADSREHEEEFYQFLTQRVPEVQVHEQKRLRPGNIASDFFIYTDSKDSSCGFAIDIFYAASVFNLLNIINLKLKRYSKTTVQTYLVAKVDGCDESILNKAMGKKKSPLPHHIHVCTEQYFKNNFTQIYLAHRDGGG